ncbi:unnamed protein product [Soboliphyme baturini]|uniref:U1-type domain-containing protein n=1 Tax=Soboliphyme baturini TaxID=241478 RepID=A0A183IKU6_9BILA|nr:unnamed protein product [Soboliphyme baturini]
MVTPVKVDDFRRKWDVAEYERLAQERIEEERAKLKEKEDKKPREKVKREFLKPRDYKIDLESKVGKSVVITKTTPASEAGGYYCNVCDCVVKDSINFLDHINGKKHQRNLGMSMRVKKSTLEDVKARFALKRQEAEEKKKTYDIEERMKEIIEEEQRLAEYRKQKKQEHKKRKQDETEQADPEIAAVMGFSGFSTSKK